MKRMHLTELLPVFFGLSACSWVPHWACHYYRIETNSSFVVGTWSLSFVESSIALIAYGLLIAINLLSIPAGFFRVAAAGLSGLGHVVIGLVHAYRLLHPFTFEVFGYAWTYGASLREAVVVIPFGLLCLVVAAAVRRLDGLAAGKVP